MEILGWILMALFIVAGVIMLSTSIKRKKKTSRATEVYNHHINRNVPIKPRDPDMASWALPKGQKQQYDRASEITEARSTINDSSFADSMMIGALTNSTIMGTVIGGDITGALIGDAMVPDTDNSDSHTGDSYDSNSDSSYDSGSDSSYDSGGSSDCSSDSSSCDSGGF